MIIKPDDMSYSYITDIDSNFELATKEDYNRERESISEAIEEVLRHYDKNR